MKTRKTNQTKEQIKKIQEDTKRQILKMVNDYRMDSWEGFIEAKTDETKECCKSQFNAFDQIYLAINTFKIK